MNQENKEILKELSILYAEDEIEINQFTSKTLAVIAKKVVSVYNGIEGIEEYHKQGPFDVIITDINMPKLDGLGMCKKIREYQSDIPIVITSAHNDSDFLRKSIELGVGAYAIKPVDIFQLIESILKAVEPVYLRKKLQKINISLEDKVSEKTKQITTILDNQESLIIVTDGEKVIMANKRFLDFFDMEGVKDFDKENHYFKELLEKIKNLFDESELETKNWIDKLEILNKKDSVVTFTKDKQDIIFTISINKYIHDGAKYIISLTDITEHKKNEFLLEYQATHDFLTGLYNRKKFLDILSIEIKRTKRYKNPLSLIMFDIDFFKKINDTYGHDMGDEVLKIISSSTKILIREQDSAVRWGGEEFIILLPETTIDEAEIVARKLNQKIKDLEIENLPQKVTVSVGVTCYKDKDNGNIDKTLKRVDEALYIAKDTGRDKVVVL
jgi:diguanylate cyclase (GGDEF)-like protein